MLTLPRLVLRNLRYHWRADLAVLLGVAVGSAVLTGALLVGDSLRGSLRARAERQLNDLDAVAVFRRPVRAGIANGLPGRTTPALLLQGSARRVRAGDDPDAPSLGRVTVVGMDRRALRPGATLAYAFWGTDGGAAAGRRVVERLGLRSGDGLRLGLPPFSDVPRSSLLARRALADVTAGVSLPVAAFLAPHEPLNDFNLSADPAAPLNVFVALPALSAALDEPGGRGRGDPPVRANALFSSGATVADLNAALRDRLTLADYGLRVRVPKSGKGYVAVEPEGLLMDEPTARAVEAAAADLRTRAEPTLVYLVNSIRHDGKEIPYSVVAALNPAAAPPLGPFLPPGVSELKDDEIVLADWPESPLKGLPAGTELAVGYYDPEVEGEGRVREAKLTLRGYVPLAGAAADRDLTPPVKGITDENANIFDWDRPPQLTNAKVKEKIKPGDAHEAYWRKYKATPKAYVNTATGAKLFGSRYGSVTSVRVAPGPGESPEQLADRLGPAVLKHLDPAAAGFVFDPIRERLLTAGRGGTDFGGLFLGFSLFLIAAALMLVGLLFRLSLDRRAKEVGLLLAAGYSVRQVRRLVLAEGLVLAVVGAAVGLLAGVWYNQLLLRVLLELWPDPEVGAFLKPHSTPTSFVIGFGAAVAMALVALWFGVRWLVRVSPPALLRGETAGPTLGPSRRPWVSLALIAAALLVGVGLLAAGGSVANPDYRAMTFFGGGALLLTAALLGFRAWMRRDRRRDVTGRGVTALARLGSRNAARNPTRSLLTAALLAAAAFLLVAVESFRREPGRDFAAVTGGSGGFNLLAEVDVPVYQPLDTGPGRTDLEDRLVRAYGRSTDDPRYQQAVADLDALKPNPDGTPNVVPLRLRPGDDASCLNLFQAARPRVLGVPDSLVRRGGFRFYQTEAATPEEKANPWLLLTKEYPGGAVPVFAENNTAVWQLKTGVGGELKLPDDAGNEVTLRVVGTLADSPFQSELLMADGNFVRLFPKADGYRAFLVRTPPGTEDDIARVLRVGLRENGLEVTPTREKVAAYQAVIGAYLSTFQLLGGFGLLLGVLGLAVVVLRGVWERVGELALLRAVGYRPRAVQFLVLAENAFVLLVGLTAGVVAAGLSVAPHVAGGAAVPWGRLAALLGL
ncbi:MAG: ABC transporter permease, partial [Gemmataceae bacterium]|nr:ABC transporter permease [Gemmataceae bacterium]